jgi:transposase
LDEVRRWAYSRLSAKDLRFIKGQRYNLLSRREDLTTEGRRVLQLLFRANKQLHKTHLPKEWCSQLWDYNRPG